MITTTSHEAAKLLKKLNEDYSAMLRKEEKSSVFRAAMGEDPETVRPAYDYAATRDELDLLEEKIRRLKHAINVFNTTHTVPGYDMTVDEMLVRLPLLSGKKQKLAEMISKLPKERAEPEYGRTTNIIDYNYINYDLDAVKADYEKVCAELADSQLALDNVNARETFDVDL